MWMAGIPSWLWAQPWHNVWRALATCHAVPPLTASLATMQPPADRHQSPMVPPLCRSHPAAPVKEALLRVVAESDGRGMRALATALLAAAEGVGPLLVQHPRALAAVLGRLEAAAAEAEEGQPAKRARTDAPEAEASSAEKQAGEEVEAAWALCSELARSLAQPAAAAEGEGAAEGAAAGGGTDTVLAVLAEHAGVLGRDWGDDDPSLAAHQAYVLGRVLPLLAGLGDAAAAELAAAAERAQAAASAAQQ